MKKDIRILNIFLYISLFYFYSCFLIPPPPKSSKIISIKTEIFDFKTVGERIEEYNNKNIKEGDKNTCFNSRESESSKIKEGEVFEFLTGRYVTWAKSANLNDIKDKHNSLIKDLEGLKYSYIFFTYPVQNSFMV